jgi:hypothetical protein
VREKLKKIRDDLLQLDSESDTFQQALTQAKPKLADCPEGTLCKVKL